MRHDHKNLYIDGGWVPSQGTGLIEVADPATEEIIGRVPDAAPADIDRAVDAARRAYDTGPWPRMSPLERADVLDRLAAALRERAGDLTELVVAEGGFPVMLAAEVHVRQAISALPYYAGLVRTSPQATERPGLNGQILVRTMPVGVVAAIVPWNMPLAGVLLKLAPALAAGCCVVVKPSPLTPLTAQVVAEAADLIGLPPGVLNIVPALQDGAAHLVAHPGVDKVAFTGSTAVGRAIAESCARRMKRCSLELGGNAAAVVLADASAERTAAGLVMSALACNNGEACIAQTRVLVPRDRQDEFAEALGAAARGIPVGPPGDPGTLLGPMITSAHRERVLARVRSGVDDGAELVHGGGPVPHLDRGWYLEPTVLARVDNAMAVAREEIFGPVVTLIPYDGEEQAVAIANDTRYGLSGSIWSADQDRAASLGRRIRAGSVYVNEGFAVELNAPFGGLKESGIGRENGPEGLAAYSEIQTMQLPPAPRP